MTHNTTILTVDDNDALRYTLTRTLRAEGYQVMEARSGAEALRLANKIPDLITLDLNLPDVDGFEVCRRIRENPSTSHIPIVHISATFVEPEHRVRGLDGGADAFLAEPISGAELVATIGALLRMKDAERKARLQAEEAERTREELRKAHDELEMRVRERTAELANKNNEIRELSGRLLKSQDDERRRLARELHDTTGQLVVAMKMNLGLIKSKMPGQSELIERLFTETLTMTEEASRQIRTMSYLLHPPMLDEAGLQSALRWYAEGFAQRSGVQVELRINPDFPRLADDQQIALFRVVQESLTNIHRHSGSSTATILLDNSFNEVRLEIIDTGTEASSQVPRNAKFSPGVGIMGMQERMRQVGGTFEITALKPGAKVVATIPAQVLPSD